MHILGSLFLLPLLSSCLKVNDCVIGIAALVGNIFGCLVIAFARSPLIFYLGTIVLLHLPYPFEINFNVLLHIKASFGFVLTGSIGVVVKKIID